MGKDYKSLVPYLASQGILFRHPWPYTYQQNGKAERKHRHIVENGLTLLAFCGISLKFWWFAFQTSVYLLNKVP